MLYIYNISGGIYKKGYIWNEYVPWYCRTGRCERDAKELRNDCERVAQQLRKSCKGGTPPPARLRNRFATHSQFLRISVATLHVIETYTCKRPTRVRDLHARLTHG